MKGSMGQDIPRRRRPGPLDAVRTNPLFGAAAVMFIIVIAAIVWMVGRAYTGPAKFVTVETFPVGQSANVGGVAIEVVRVTHLPQYDIRLTGVVRDRSDPMVFIDGTIRNEASQPLAVFLPSSGRSEPAVLTTPGGRSTAATVGIIAATTCSNVSAATSILAPSERRRFSIRVPVGRNSSSAWVLSSIRRGSLPAISLGDFTTDSDCAAAEADLPQKDRWRVSFTPVDLATPEPQDFYPFGAPTAQETGVNGRRYWTLWVPRTGD